MEGFILGAMGLVVLVVAGLVLVGGRSVKNVSSGDMAREPERWPPVALIVPVTGAAPGLGERLGSLLTQDYPDYQVIFATRDREDPATGVIMPLISGHPRAGHVLSGRATACGQKNQNLLAGLRTIGEGPEILAFCDSNQLAPATWLKELVRPIALGEAEVTSGYHHIIPQDKRIATLGRAISVLTLYLTKGFKRLNQPWGGATGIARSLFESLGVAKLWAENVVDDVSLAARLIRAGILVGVAPGACLSTPLAGETLTGWSQWLTRQWLYLKFCLPGTWLAAGLLQHLLAILVIVAGGRCLLGLVGWSSPAAGLSAALFLTLLTGLGAALRPLHPSPGPLKAWLAAFYAAIFMASWCHLQTCFTQHLHWRGISYRVGRGGRVTEVREG
ncbi:MAG: glycosyltransferase [Desulfobaccales bacterium]|nr:glycosyltransferase [Desulfobaccales bacterium]